MFMLLKIINECRKIPIPLLKIGGTSHETNYNFLSFHIQMNNNRRRKVHNSFERYN